MNEDVIMNVPEKPRKSSIIITILLTAIISFFVGMLFGKNDNMSGNIGNIATNIKKNVANITNKKAGKNTKNSELRDKITKKIKQINDIEEDDWKDDEEDEHVVVDDDSVAPAVSDNEIPNDTQDALRAKLLANLRQQETSNSEQKNNNTDIVINDISTNNPAENEDVIMIDNHNIGTSGIVNDENALTYTQPVLNDTMQTNINNIDNTANTTDTKNKDTVYVVMVNNNNGPVQTTDNQNSDKQPEQTFIVNETNTSQPSDPSIQKSGNTQHNGVSSNQSAKSNNTVPTKKQIKNKTTNKPVAKSNTKPKVQKKKPAKNIVKQRKAQSRSQSKISNNVENNKTDTNTADNSIETEELIIELDNEEDIQKLQNVDVETLIVVDNETGEEYEIIPETTHSTNSTEKQNDKL